MLILGHIRAKPAILSSNLKEELEHSVPNMWLSSMIQISAKMISSRELIKTQLKVAKPSFANHQMFCKDLGGDDYCIASCYNGLKIGGGAYTLVRMRLGPSCWTCWIQETFYGRSLPSCCQRHASLYRWEYASSLKTVTFSLANFPSSWRFSITRERFSAMFGLVGLVECVNTLLAKEGLKEERLWSHWIC